MNRFASRVFVLNVRARWLLAAAVALAVIGLLFGRAIQRRALSYFVLHREASNPEAVASILQNSPDPAAAFSNLWGARKLPQRLMALQWVAGPTAENPDLLRRSLPVIRAAALDGDEDTREQALGLLDTQKDPALVGLAHAQLRDADPQLRILGLTYLGRDGSSNLVRAVVPLLDDPEPAVAVQADALLRKWTGQDFGARLRAAVPDSSGALDSSQLASVANAVRQWHEWWPANQMNYPHPTFDISTPDTAADPPAADFALRDLDGHRIHLSDFKGKVVLLNFWATWCNACLEETPRLVALRKRLPADVAILGICLDGATLGDDDDEEAAPAQSQSSDPRRNAARAVRTFNINYPVLLDSDGSIAARFDGGELPTNVIIDRDGRIRRRFVGGRSVGALEAMLGAAQR